ncbi:MAG TPA: dTDP-4-dehydrorhamnose 3,5-epimerase [Ignavibacteria bacterium]|nr:dTDP-4-dehydrorhamnose 3,5-epimerase [Ignavibacteria bacterium]HMR41806.1 dTDP-4-dehydrorhamnose 3,5-epimerase [Ignavibacteria bacterium]
MPITVSKTDLNDVILIKPSIFEDHRGMYVETFNEEDYKLNNINTKFVRDDISTSSRNVLRGLHYDNKTWKLIHCMYGKIFFVVADMREDSGQYLKWQSFILTSDNRHQVLVPPGFANGHYVLSDHCIFHYKMSEYYDPENEKGVKWNDPKLGIFWPADHPVLSEKDSNTKLL